MQNKELGTQSYEGQDSNSCLVLYGHRPHRCRSTLLGRLWPLVACPCAPLPTPEAVGAEGKRGSDLVLLCVRQGWRGLRALPPLPLTRTPNAVLIIVPELN